MVRKKYFDCSRYCVEAKSTFLSALVELEKKPEIKENESIAVKITINPAGHVYQHPCQVRWYLPDGWTVSGKKDLHIHRFYHYAEIYNVGNYVITAGEKVAASNHVVLEVQPVGRTESVFVSFNILG